MIATYRLQLEPDFGFDSVRQLLPYFQQLGISHLYLSPITEASPGSAHGYDVIDHNQVRQELGGAEAFEELRIAAHQHDLELIIDFVPNHAYVGPRNRYWQDLLAYGPHSPYASYFDIDWRPLKQELQNKILLPFLGQQYGAVLEEGEIEIIFENGQFYAAYYDNRFALSPASYHVILERLLNAFEETDHYWTIKDLAEAYRTLLPKEREKAETFRSRLVKLAQTVSFEEALLSLQGEDLHNLLEKQFWRLSFWKTAGYEVNYRRFFDINGLVALRMEDEEVFWDAHRLLGDLLTRDGVSGVRIDHVDGLFDPHQYLERLSELGASQVWVEKILAPGETLPQQWPVEGTTGYEFMNDTMGILLQPDGEIPLDKIYDRFVPEALSYEQEVYQSKMLVMTTSLSSERFRLSYELDRIAEANYHTRDFTLVGLRESLSEVLAAFKCYRTYLPYSSEEAQEMIQKALHIAQQRSPATEPTVFDFIGRVILGDVQENLQPVHRAWTGRFQQYTAPVAAKGVEDTAFYRYLRLVALNEVGGDPDRFGQSVHAFHAHARFRAHRYPNNLLTTATHDHKRGEDTRMRLVALAEVTNRWEETVQALAKISEKHRGLHGPSKADEYLFYQVLAALWQDPHREKLPERLWQYMQKASRESKRRTSWINPNPDYEADLETFVRSLVQDPRLPEILDEFTLRLSSYGFFNSLSQLVLKCTTPGVPDFYQGCELLDLSLVDPDNRRPVDYELRSELLDQLKPLLEAPSPNQVQALIEKEKNQAKFYVTAQLLRLRNRFPRLLAAGYQPLSVEGPGQDHWIAYGRVYENLALVGVVPRFPYSWPDNQQATVELPAPFANRSWEEALSGQRLELNSELATDQLALPWGVLHSTSDL